MPEDPFETLGVDRRFKLDGQVLRQRFLAASSEMHPDRFPDPLEQVQAVEKMSRITDAYRVLMDPESRAQALLRLSGMEDEGDRDKLPPDLLMEVMEIREEMEAALESSNRIELDRLRQWANGERESYLYEIGKLFEKDIDKPLASEVRLKLNALRYVQRMLEQLPAT